MEEEIDGLDLTVNYTGEKEESGQEPEDKGGKEPEEQAGPEKGEEGDKGDGEPEDKGEPEKKDGTEPKSREDGGEAKPDDKGPFGQKGHTPKGVQERINSLSRSNRELREQNEKILAELEKFKASIPKPPEKTEADFPDSKSYVNYLAEQKAREIVEAQLAKERERMEMDSLMAEYRKSEDSARKALGDYDDVVSSVPDLKVDKDTYMYVMKSPEGAMINYTLKKVESVRNQFLMTPDAGKLAFVKGVEARLREIRQQAERTKAAPQQTPPASTPPATQQPMLRQPAEAKRPVSRTLNPATCSMDEWMENGD